MAQNVKGVNMFVLIGVFATLVLVFVSMICHSWWILVTGLGLAILAGTLFGSFAIQGAFRTWMAATADWERRLGWSAVIFGIIVMVILIMGVLAYRYTDSLPCARGGGCVAATITAPAATGTFTMIATTSAPAVVVIRPGQRVCWPLEFDRLVDSRVEWRGTTKIRIFTPKPGAGSIEIPFTRYQL